MGELSLVAARVVSSLIVQHLNHKTVILKTIKNNKGKIV